MDAKNLRLYKTQQGVFELRDGDKAIGSVATVIMGNNQPTGEYCYTIGTGPGYHKMNWHAGHSAKEAGILLARKLGYKL